MDTPAKTVLIADDHPQVRKLLRWTLEDGLPGQLRILETGYGREAIRLILAEHPDLLITDDILPDICGHRLCHELRIDPETASLRIVMVPTRELKPGLSLEADAYFPKPFSPIALSEKVTQLLER